MTNLERSKSNATRNLSYLLIGGGIGATLALLFAPKSGSELREDISTAASNGLEKTRETVGQIRENANAYYETAKDKATNLYSTVSAKTDQLTSAVKEIPEQTESLIEDKVEQVSSAVEAGQKEYKRKSHNV
jgi:gas vesicle protein